MDSTKFKNLQVKDLLKDNRPSFNFRNEPENILSRTIEDKTSPILSRQGKLSFLESIHNFLHSKGFTSSNVTPHHDEHIETKHIGDFSNSIKNIKDKTLKANLSRTINSLYDEGDES